MTCVQRLDKLLLLNILAASDIYKRVTFLNPKLCQLKMIGDNKGQSVIHAVKVLVDELGFDEENTEENLTATCHLPPALFI